MGTLVLEREVTDRRHIRSLNDDNEGLSQPARRTRERGESNSSSSQRVDDEGLLARYARTHDPALRERIVLGHRTLVRYLASKFANRGEPLEDLVQVGTIGLINAIDRYEPSRGLKFATYATPTIVGEIQRYFRDKCSRIHVPRHLQELNYTAARVHDKLSGELGRKATVQEVAKAIGASEEETLEAMELGNVCTIMSLDTQIASEGDNAPLSLSEFLGAEDSAVQALSEYGDLDVALAALEPRERTIIVHRFLHDMSQSEIAQRLNISQMHVSRLQKKALEHLKEIMNANGSTDQ